MASIATAAAALMSPIGGFEPIRKDQISITPDAERNAPEYTDEAAAQLVWQDYQSARTEIDNNLWLTQWTENDRLYQSPTLGTSGDGRFARVSRFTVNNDTNTMGDAVKQGLFSQKPPFFLRPRGKTTQNEVKAWSALLDTLLDRMKFQYWTNLGIEGMTLDGTAIWKGGWSTRKIVKKRRKLKNKEKLTVDQPQGGPLQPKTKESFATEEYFETIEESYPWLEQRMLGTTIFDAGWRTPNHPELSACAIDIDFPTWQDLEELRGDVAYKIPSAEALRDYFFKNIEAPAPEDDEDGS